MNLKSSSKAQTWAGRIVSGLVVAALGMSAVMKLSPNAQVVTDFVGKFGYAESTLAPLGVVELLCAILYAIPKTSVLGAILLTGYLGGAVATHVRIGDPFVVPVVLGVFVWAGLYLRDERLRALVPLRS